MFEMYIHLQQSYKYLLLVPEPLKLISFFLSFSSIIKNIVIWFELEMYTFVMMHCGVINFCYSWKEKNNGVLLGGFRLVFAIVEIGAIILVLYSQQLVTRLVKLLGAAMRVCCPVID